ncbi:MAG: sugar O-acetyltransferase [Pseudomonadota bacterium]
MSAQVQMLSGAWYSCLDPALDALRAEARRTVHAHNHAGPEMRRGAASPLAALFASWGDGTHIEAPFHCSYGIHTRIGAGCYINAGCVILDSAPVTIGNSTLIGPRAQLICADHHRDPVKRREGIERALPVTLGRDVWIGAAALIMPGVTVGDGAIIGAGAVVTRDVAPGATVAGVPARPV